MKPNNFKKELEKLGIILTEKQENQLNAYATLLLEYNTHTNLTAIRTIEEVYLKHFYDSLTLIKSADITKGTLLDVGTGAGFPGLVLAIVYPKLQVTLLDSNNKKITFLKEIKSKLNLQNVEIVYRRAEEYTKINREKFDFVTSRAVAELRILIELNIPALKTKGFFLAMKGDVTNELPPAKKTLEKLNSEIIDITGFELPYNAGHRTIIKIQKQKPTESIYPRSYDKIKKKIIK